MSIQPQTLSNVLLIGESCYDVYHYGSCDRISPEAPVPVFKEIKTETRVGMAGNVFHNLEAFELKVDFITDSQQIEKHRYIDQRFNQHLLRVDKNETYMIETYKFNDKDLTNKDIVVISDYNKGFLLPDECNKLAEYCKSHNIPVFVDSKKTDLSCFEGCILKINEKENETAKKLPTTYELIITLGAKGCKYKGNIHPTEQVEVFDVCGAGDVFLAALTSSYLESQDLNSAIDFANRCASYSVTKFGTYVLTEKDIDDLCV